MTRGGSINRAVLFLLLLATSHSTYSRPRASPPRVVVVGGGAAGYFAAIECSRAAGVGRCEVVVLEATKEPLAKVLISGGGRCNVMHDPMKTPSEISTGYPRGARELIGALTSQFTPWDTFDWFSSRGVELKTERDGRVFPVTNKAESIAQTLRTDALKLGVEVVTGARVTTIARCPITGQFNLTCSADSLGHVIMAQSVILATGASRPSYHLVTSLGHSITPPLPSLFSFKIQDENLTALAGVAAPSARVKILVPSLAAKKSKSSGPGPVDFSLLKEHLRPNLLKQYTQRGPLLVTHQGLSGPAVLRLSAFAARLVAGMRYTFEIEVKWICGGGSGVGTGTFNDGDEELSDERVSEHFLQIRKRFPTRLVGKGFPPLSLSLAAVEGSGGGDDAEGEKEWGGEGDDEEDKDGGAGESGELGVASIKRRLWLYLLMSKCDPPVEPTTKWRDVKPKEVASMVNAIMHSRYVVTGRGLYRDEFVTAGGVPLKEINMRTMESKLSPGLFLCGELVDIDGVTGGYNFQSAWTTGYVAGSSCGKALSCVDSTQESSKD